ncbi:B3 DNA binding domain containing protein [Trema orientale]|uniref:B3 DNA binding domain containing protein n=1 Tax=Trema orientale TaxID=63057 RepID=A0A2P5B5P8_TREOI|nr:B3 DNA binding domain containing protein [Trema orientale]
MKEQAAGGISTTQTCPKQEAVRRRRPVTRTSMILPKSAGLYSGWSAFAVENNLGVGDVCIFELVTTTEKNSFRVFIERLANDEYHQIPEALCLPLGLATMPTPLHGQYVHFPCARISRYHPQPLWNSRNCLTHRCMPTCAMLPEAAWRMHPLASYVPKPTGPPPTPSSLIPQWGQARPSTYALPCALARFGSTIFCHACYLMPWCLLPCVMIEPYTHLDLPWCLLPLSPCHDSMHLGSLTE